MKSLLIIGLFVFSVFSKEQLPIDLEKVGVVEHLGDTLNLNLPVTNSVGETRPLAAYFEPGKPVLLTTVYYECPMLCNVILNSLITGLDQMKWIPGKEFKIVSISIDPEEGSKLAKAKKGFYIDAMKNKPIHDGWDFFTASKEVIKEITSTVGFNYKKLDNGEYSHGAAIFVLSDNGQLMRYIYGIDYTGFKLKRSLLDAKNKKQVSVIDKIIMFCYQYSKDAKGYILFAKNLMTASGIFILFIVSFVLFYFWIKEFKKMKKRD